MSAAERGDRWRWVDLSYAQADGLACVVCGRDFAVDGHITHLPVGRSATGSQVFACERTCAPDGRPHEPGGAR